MLINFLCEAKSCFLLLWFISYLCLHTDSPPVSASFRSWSPFSYSGPSHLLLPYDLLRLCFPSAASAFCCLLHTFFQTGLLFFLFILGQIPVNYSNSSVLNLMLSYTVLYLCRTLAKQVMDHTAFLKVIPRYPTCIESKCIFTLLR